MKVAILSESPADEAAIRILIDGILGESTEHIAYRARPHGIDAVLRLVPSVLRELHFKSAADALLVVVDSDTTPVHTANHVDDESVSRDCRFCQLQCAIARVSLSLVADKPSIRTAVGLAVPTVEAWYRCGQDPHVNEAAWGRALAARQFPYDGKSLKRAVYGTDRPSLALETERATDAARRLVATPGGLASLERLFPGGFATMAREVRSWR
jgi:hypothetical protein